MADDGLFPTEDVPLLIDESIGIHPTAKRRHKPSTRFSHFEGCPAALVERILQSPCQQTREGVLIVKVADTTGFYAKTDRDARDPSTREFHKPAAREVRVVIYSQEVLGSRASGPLMEIVSINAY